MRRFVVIVLDGFGIGAMDDAKKVRPGDEKANTLRSILNDEPDLKLPNLEFMGLMNAYGKESEFMKFSLLPCCVFRVFLTQSKGKSANFNHGLDYCLLPL